MLAIIYHQIIVPALSAINQDKEFALTVVTQWGFFFLLTHQVQALILSMKQGCVLYPYFVFFKHILALPLHLLLISFTTVGVVASKLLAFLSDPIGVTSWLYNFKIPAILNSVPLLGKIGYLTGTGALFNDTLAFIATWPSLIDLTPAPSFVTADSIGSHVILTADSVASHALTDGLDLDNLRALEDFDYDLIKAECIVDDWSGFNCNAIVPRRHTI